MLWETLASTQVRSWTVTTAAWRAALSRRSRQSACSTEYSRRS